MQRHALKLTLLDTWGAFPAAGDRHIAEFVPWVLTEESDWGAAFNIELTSIATGQGHQDGYIADVDAWLAGTKTVADLGVGRAAVACDPVPADRRGREPPANIPNAGQVPDVPEGRGGGVDLRDRRRRHPRSRPWPRCPAPTPRSSVGTWPCRS